MIYMSSVKISQRGSALIQLMVVAAVLSIMGLGLFQVIQNSLSSQNYLNYRNQRRELRENLQKILLTEQYCMCSFQNVVVPDPLPLGFSARVTALQLRETANDCNSRVTENFFQTGQTIKSIKAIAINLRNFMPISPTMVQADLEIKLENSQIIYGGPSVTEVIPVALALNNMRTVISCGQSTLAPLEMLPISNVAVRLRPSRAGLLYQFTGLNIVGEATVIAKVDFRWGKNFGLTLLKPDNSLPTDYLSSTGADGHIRHDSFLAFVKVTDGQFRAKFDCNASPCGRNPDEWSQITPLAVMRPAN